MLDNRIGRTVSNLTPVPLQRPEFLSFRVVFCANWNSHDVSSLVLQLVKKRRPHLLAVLFREIWVIERDVNAGDECIVESPDPVGGEEKNTLAILHCPQEGWNSKLHHRAKGDFI